MKKFIFFNVIFIFLIIFFLEFFLRFFTSINELGIEKNLINLKSEIRVHNKNIKSVVYGKISYIDKYGFRVPYEKYEYDTNPKSSVLILGDSVSFGVGVLDQYTFVGILRNKFNNINFYNSSVIGHSSQDHHKLLKFYDKKINYNQILLIYCLNDIVNTSGVLTRDDFYKKNYLLVKINIFLRNKSYLYIYIKSLLTDPQKRYFDYIEPLYKDKKSLDSLNNIFYEIQKFSKSNNKKITFVILPYEYQTRSENCNEDTLTAQNELLKILNKNNLNFYDLTSNFCKFDNPKNLYLKYDPVHLSIEGHNFVSQLLDKFLFN